MTIYVYIFQCLSIHTVSKALLRACLVGCHRPEWVIRCDREVEGCRTPTAAAASSSRSYNWASFHFGVPEAQNWWASRKRSWIVGWHYIMPEHKRAQKMVMKHCCCWNYFSPPSRLREFGWATPLIWAPFLISDMEIKLTKCNPAISWIGSWSRKTVKSSWGALAYLMVMYRR